MNRLLGTVRRRVLDPPSRTLLIDPDNGRGLGIALFETEEDLRQGDATLNEMSPEGDGMGKRISVETYEVAADMKA